MDSGSADIKGFLETSFLDWPGKVASVVFLPRCNYRCPYCHNHRLVTEPETYGSWSLETVLGRLERLRDWVDGVCVTGGEPTINPGLLPLLESFAQHRWPVKLDTNGSRPEVVEEILRRGLAEAFSVDVKAPLEPIPYRRNAGPGGDPAQVEKTLKLLAAAGVPVELRTTVHPKLLSVEELDRLARGIGEIFGPGVTWKLQRCRTQDVLDPALSDDPNPPETEIFDAWVRQIRKETFRGKLLGP
jgi:pyruvate formate lyase activating enzyme